MEALEKLKGWLVGFPGWDAEAIWVDSTSGVPGSCGLFPQGLELVKRQEDVLGNVRGIYRFRCLLRRVALRQEAAAVWLLELQEWVRQQSDRQLAPRFGDDGYRERLRAEKGRLIRAEQVGTAAYEVVLTAEFMKEETYGEN